MSNIIIVKKMKRAYTHDQDSASQRKSLHTQTDPDNLFQCDLTLPNILLPFYAVAHINGLVRTKAD